jgi:TRAP-type transport system small permease protein
MKIVRLVSRWFGYVSCVMLGLMMLLTTVDVVMRYIFNRPITGAPELSELMMVILVFPALAWITIDRSQIRVDILVNGWRRKTQLIVEILTLILTLATYGVLTWQGAVESMATTDTSSLLQVPESLFRWVATIGFALFCVTVVSLIIEDMAALGKGEHP